MCMMGSYTSLRHSVLITWTHTKTSLTHIRGSHKWWELSIPWLSRTFICGLYFNEYDHVFQTFYLIDSGPLSSVKPMYIDRKPLQDQLRIIHKKPLVLTFWVFIKDPKALLQVVLHVFVFDTMEFCIYFTVYIMHVLVAEVGRLYMNKQSSCLLL